MWDFKDVQTFDCSVFVAAMIFVVVEELVMPKAPRQSLISEGHHLYKKHINSWVELDYRNLGYN